ncbi:TPA: hypothetical protein SIC87_002249 [Pasteurella multocida]|uniref:hypothetical protein n=1 Tax=Pasteurella multocida TaxID=747 RepID=UPI0029BA8672|nr:hypothetical protein [Pasteurella multocida]HEH9625241.1 hypothetical protein [Pasteurella multocida]HEH9638271.1 hypothetical protein [Pasteurella multocida]HEH9660528.1 hypothetical protein [Pasteurella multocida]HEH9662814.1 hypothetical protein [Pasteurella multocida]
MGILSFFSKTAKENEIKDVVRSIFILARKRPERFFLEKYLEDYRNSWEERDDKKCNSILHNIFSVHLERNGVFEQEFGFVNNSENIKNLIDLEIRKIYEDTPPPEIFSNSYNDIEKVIKNLHIKYCKYPDSFFVELLKKLNFMTAKENNDAAEMMKMIEDEFRNILKYYGVYEKDVKFIAKDENLRKIYTGAIYDIRNKVSSLKNLL